MLNRRHFIQKTAASSMLGFASFPWTTAADKKRQFTMHLDGGAIGVDASQKELINLAHQHGFESVSAFPSYLVDLSPGEMETLLGEMKQKKLVWATAGLPMDFRKDPDTFQQGLAKLPSLAKGLQRAGVTRVGTWIMPNHPDLNYLQNFRQHAVRLREAAAVLEDHGLRLGLEYVGPKTLWTANTFPFMHTMTETQELITAIRRPNVGLLLDSFHWFTAGEQAKDILKLSNQEVVACDLNDGHQGRSREEQIDGQRELPLTSGVIDAKAFLEALVAIGYDGPVRAEPFNQALNQLDNQAAVQKTAQAMKKAFALVG